MLYQNQFETPPGSFGMFVAPYLVLQHMVWSDYGQLGSSLIPRRVGWSGYEAKNKAHIWDFCND